MPIQEIIECACGCGNTLEKFDKVGRPRKYIYNHHKTKKRKEDVIKGNIIIDDNGCWIWQGYKLSHSGHGQLGYRGKLYLAHRFSYETFKGKIKEQINHKCGNASCVNPKHLYDGTQAENVKDYLGYGLSNNDVMRIKILYPMYKQYELAEMFNTNQGYISKILNGKRR